MDSTWITHFDVCSTCNGGGMRPLRVPVLVPDLTS